MSFVFKLWLCLCQMQGHSPTDQCTKSEISLSFFMGNYRCVFLSLPVFLCLCEHASLSLWGMTSLVVEGSSCALDLVCVVLPCPVIGSRLLAAAWVKSFHSVIWWAFNVPNHAYYVTLHRCVTEYAPSTWTVCHLSAFSRFQLVFEQCWV